MKRGILVGVLIALLILNASFIFAQDEAVDTKAYKCLTNKVVGNCDSLSSEDRIFSLLAIGQCKDEVLEDAKYKTDTKSTAQAILALSKAKLDTTDAELWLLNQNMTAPNIDWFLQIESNEETSCSITYAGSPHSITIGTDRKISLPAGDCLPLSEGNYWLKISPNCHSNEFSIQCNKAFSTNLLYKETNLDTIYVSAKSNTASADGTTTEKVNSFCFTQNKISCDYEATLWATLILGFKGYTNEVNFYLPYLITQSEKLENKKFLPESFLWPLTLANDYRAGLLAKQKTNKYWDESNDRFYDTAVALLPFRNEDLTEKVNSKNWLTEIQREDGCWETSVKNIAFLLYSLWPKESTIIEDDIDCEASGNYCSHPVACLNAEGEILPKEYTGCFGADVCCTKKTIVETCSKQEGNICGSNKDCDGTTVEASDTGYGEVCCIGKCVEIVVQEECELAGGYCRTACLSDEEKSDLYDCSSGVCCVKKTQTTGSYWWVWFLLILIVLVVLGIIFKDKLRPFWFKIKTKFNEFRNKSKARPRSNSPHSYGGHQQRNVPRRSFPPTKGRPIGHPTKKNNSSDVEDVLKKLKEMGK